MLRKLSKLIIVAVLAVGIAFSVTSEASASGFTYWYNDGSTVTQLYYATDSGTYALPIYMASTGYIFDLTGYQNIVYYQNP